MTLRACPRRTRVKVCRVRSVAPGKERSVSLVARVKTVMFYNLRRSEARSGMDDVLWKQSRYAYGVNCVDCDCRATDNSLTHGNSISDYLVLQKAVAWYS